MRFDQVVVKPMAGKRVEVDMNLPEHVKAAFDGAAAVDEHCWLTVALDPLKRQINFVGTGPTRELAEEGLKEARESGELPESALYALSFDLMTVDALKETIEFFWAHGMTFEEAKGNALQVLKSACQEIRKIHLAGMGIDPTKPLTEKDLQTLRDHGVPAAVVERTAKQLEKEQADEVLDQIQGLLSKIFDEAEAAGGDGDGQPV